MSVLMTLRVQGDAIGKAMAQAGVTSAPETTFYRQLNLGDDID